MPIKTYLYNSIPWNASPLVETTLKRAQLWALYFGMHKRWMSILADSMNSAIRA
jgi:hypothetical protein